MLSVRKKVTDLFAKITVESLYSQQLKKFPPILWITDSDQLRGTLQKQKPVSDYAVEK